MHRCPVAVPRRASAMRCTCCASWLTVALRSAISAASRERTAAVSASGARGRGTLAAALWNASSTSTARFARSIGQPRASRGQIGDGQPAVGDARAARDQLGHRSRNIAPRRALTASLGCLERRD